MDLQAKRATLVSQLEQFVGQINRINGAIAVLDELLAEQAAEQDAQREAEEASLATYEGIDRTTNSYWRNKLDEEIVNERRTSPERAPMTPPAPHQMLPVIHEEDPERYLAPKEDAA